MKACASKLKLNVFVDLVYVFHLTPCKQGLCGVCHYTAHSHTSLFSDLSVVTVCVGNVITALHKSNENHMH